MVTVDGEFIEDMTLTPILLVIKYAPTALYVTFPTQRATTSCTLRAQTALCGCQRRSTALIMRLRRDPSTSAPSTRSAQSCTRRPTPTTQQGPTSRQRPSGSSTRWRWATHLTARGRHWPSPSRVPSTSNAHRKPMVASLWTQTSLLCRHFRLLRTARSTSILDWPTTQRTSSYKSGILFIDMMARE